MSYDAKMLLSKMWGNFGNNVLHDDETYMP